WVKEVAPSTTEEDRAQREHVGSLDAPGAFPRPPLGPPQTRALPPGAPPGDGSGRAAGRSGEANHGRSLRGRRRRDGSPDTLPAREVKCHKKRARGRRSPCSIRQAMV